MAEEQPTAEPGQDLRLYTKSDEWLARLLGGDLQIAMLRLFGAVVAFLVIGATVVRLVIR